MTVFEVQSGDDKDERADGDSEASDSAPNIQSSEPVKLPGKVTVVPSPDSVVGTCKMSIEEKQRDPLDMQLVTMISELSVTEVQRRDDRTVDYGGGDEEDDDVIPHEDEETDEESEEVLYTDRGPMMGGRHPTNRKHPYETTGSGHQGEAVSPSSSTEANDSESSMTSSPDSSPRHSVSIPIPSRPHYGSVGLLTVVAPIPQPRLSGDSPEPLDPSGRRRQSLCAGGGMVTTGTPEPHRKVSPSSTQQQALLPGLPFPMLTIVQAGTITIQQPPPIVMSGQLSMPSPYNTYRDTAISSSPASAHSPSLDDCLAATPSPLSDIGAPQLSPFGSVEIQEQLEQNSFDGIVAFQSLLKNSGSLSEAPVSDVDVEHQLAPFPNCNIDEVVSTLLDDLGVPDKREVFELYGRVSDGYPAKDNERKSSGQEDQFVVPQKPPLSYGSNQLRPPNDATRQEDQLSARIRRSSNPDIESKFMERMNSFKKILPKNDAVMLPPSKSDSVELAVTTSAEAYVDTQVVTLGLCTSSAPTVGKFANAVDQIRSLFTVDERNRALVAVEQWTVDDLCNPDDNGDTYLHIAIRQRNNAIVYAIVNRLIEKKRPLDVGNKSGQTPLFVAVMVNNLVFVEFLLHHGANAGCVCRDGTTPLHVVADRGDSHYEVAKRLCSAKTVEYGHRNSKGFTALHCAVQSQQRAFHIAQLLVRSGASLTDQEYCSGKTPVHLAVERGNLQMVKSLCEAAAKDKIASSLGATNYVQDTPLHSAAMIGHLSSEDRFELIKVLLAFGANPAMKNKDHKVPRDLLPPDAAADKAIRKALDPRSHDSK